LANWWEMGFPVLKLYQLPYAPAQPVKVRKNGQMRVEVKWGDEPSLR